MNEQRLFVLAEDALTRVVDQIQDDQWALHVPKTIQAKEPSLRELINYHAYDDAWVPDTLAGKTIAEVGQSHAGDLLKDDPKRSWHAIVRRAIAAVEAIPDLDKTVHLTYGDFPIRDYLQHITTFRTYRTVDLARFLHLDDHLPDELVRGMWAVIEPQAEGWRKLGVFGPQIPVPPGAPLSHRLLGLMGRQPG